MMLKPLPEFFIPAQLAVPVAPALPSMYRIHGLGVASDIVLPWCDRSREPSVQVEIRLGNAAAPPGEPAIQGGIFQTTPGHFFLNIEGVARYAVADGSRITVEPARAADPGSVRHFLLGSVFGALLHQRGLLPVHGSAIRAARGAMVIAGMSGAGKSSVAATLNERGYALLSDEISTVSGDSVYPAGMPGCLLWPDSIDELNLWSREPQAVRPGIAKHYVPAALASEGGAVPVDAIYILEFANGRTFKTHRVPGMHKLAALNKNLFRRAFLHGMCSGREYLENAAALARSARVVRVERPLGARPRDTADFLEADFEVREAGSQ